MRTTLLRILTRIAVWMRRIVLGTLAVPVFLFIAAAVGDDIAAVALLLLLPDPPPRRRDRQSDHGDACDRN